MKISYYYNWSFPWRHCELCALGLTVLRISDLRIGLALFFLEVGIRFERS